MQNKIDNIILNCNKYLKSITDSRFAFSGSYGLYINNVILPREFHDIDIKFIDLTPEERKKLKLDFHPNIDKLCNVKVDSEYKEVVFKGEKLLVYTPQSIVNFKKHTLDFLNREDVAETERTIRIKEKIINDLQFLKENYNLV